MKFIDKKEYYQLTNGIRYWTRNREERWKYISVVIRELKKYNPQSLLEAGTNAVPLSRESYILALKQNQLINDKGVIHDLNEFPYPFEDKSFDFFVALQVWEHLKYKQDAFKEVLRISNNVILSFPYLWGGNKKDFHHNIGDETIRKWTCNIEPTYTIKVGKRKIYFWIRNKSIS